MKNKPLFGSVAHTGKTFTLHYHKQGHTSAIKKTGYDNSVFNECPSGIPIVRFDLSSLKSVLESLRGEVDNIIEYYEQTPFRINPMTLEQYLDRKISQGIPIDYTD